MLSSNNMLVLVDNRNAALVTSLFCKSKILQLYSTFCQMSLLGRCYDEITTVMLQFSNKKNSSDN